jgi:hypothetical protein
VKSKPIVVLSAVAFVLSVVTFVRELVNPSIAEAGGEGESVYFYCYERHSPVCGSQWVSCVEDMCPTICGDYGPPKN